MKALYRRYRSRTLAEVVGQEHITDVLAESLKSGKVNHAYLFVGPRGTGKTSVARILAHEVNGFPYELEDAYLDIIEIDAASNTGVDNIRDLREKAMIAPAEGKYKVYIIDEVHMLSKSAFNALLKTLEEPPAHVIFIMATTDAHKVPVTIVSRAQKFVFRLADEEVMCRHLRKIADGEGMRVDDGALRVIARRSGGSFRDGLSLLDQISLLGDGEVTAKVVAEALGLPDGEGVERLLQYYTDGDAEKVVQVLGELRGAGVRAELVAEELMGRIVGEPRGEWLGLLGRLTEVGGSGFAEVKLLLALLDGRESGGSGKNRIKPLRYSGPDGSLLPREKSQGEGGQISSRGAPSEPATRIALGESSVFPPRQSDEVQPTEMVAAVARPEEEKTGKSTGGWTWEKVVEGVRRERAALGGHLGRMQADVGEGRLVIYAKTPFLKGLVDKGLKQIHAQLPEGVEVEVLATQKPVEDARMRKISDIMGGIEEVKVDG